MKAVILAGGFGTRMSEETDIKPKPMVEIGDKPILWHIMKIYAWHGVNDFIICCGYKGYVIKEYFSNYYLHASDITFDMTNNKMECHHCNSEPWRVTLVDTGENTMTGGRLKRVGKFIGDETFCFTYGDGICDINIKQLIDFHKSRNTLATVTAVQPPVRYGVLSISEDQDRITNFKEKPKEDGTWINGGFFVLEPGVLDYIDDDSTVWEQEPMQNLARDRMLSAFKYKGFWQSMDKLSDKHFLEELWNSGKAPWKIW